MGIPGTPGDPTDGGSGGGGGISPGSGSGSGGASGMQSVRLVTVHLIEAGLVDVDGSAMQGFDSVPGFWRFELWIDGQLVWAPTGTYPGDVVPFGGVLHCDAGDRVVELKWRGASNVRLGPRYLKVRGFNNVSG